MRIIYLRLAICTFIFFAIFGSLFLMKPISLTEVPMESWGAWGFILIINSFSIFGNQYSDFLQGANKIAIFRRWEMLSNILSIFSSLIVLLFDGGLLGLVLASQGWRILNIIRNYYLSCFVHDGKYKRFIHSGFDLDVWNVVWPAAWRSGLGVIFSVGVVQSSGIIFAQFGEINAVASYLLGLRIINVISEFSRAPFYTKIPQLSQAWIKGDKDLTITIANKSMFKVCWIFAISVVGCGFVSPYLLSFINSNTVFPNQLLWGVMAIAFYLERVGAMHIQLYSTSNKIIWHVVNGITGCITLVALFLLIPTYGVLAYPMAMVISSLLFSLWVSMYKSYNLLELSFSTFDMKISLPPFLFILSFLIGKLT
jgi:O-antigen/teichoic acid export membrane protein